MLLPSRGEKRLMRIVSLLGDHTREESPNLLSHTLRISSRLSEMGRLEIYPRPTIWKPHGPAAPSIPTWSCSKVPPPLYIMRLGCDSPLNQVHPLLARDEGLAWSPGVAAITNCTKSGLRWCCWLSEQVLPETGGELLPGAPRARNYPPSPQLST